MSRNFFIAHLRSIFVRLPERENARGAEARAFFDIIDARRGTGPRPTVKRGGGLRDPAALDLRMNVALKFLPLKTKRQFIFGNRKDEIRSIPCVGGRFFIQP